MREIYYTYNNEAIGSCVIWQVLNEVGTVDVSRACLVLPFLLDDRTVNYLQSIKETEITLEDLINAKPSLFSAFNKRYLSLLPVTINSVLLLSNNNFIRIDGQTLITNGELQSELEIGSRYKAIKQIVSLFCKMLQGYDTTELYRLLNIQL